MNEQTFDTITRHTTHACSRRTSLLTLGGVALAAATTRAPVAEAAKNTSAKRAKKKLKKVKQQFAQACDAQPGQCEASVQATCARINNDPSKCILALSPCCALITDCNVEPGFTCVLDTLLGL